MISEKDLKNIIAQVLEEMKGSNAEVEKIEDVVKTCMEEIKVEDEISEEELVDITATRIQDELLVPNPFNKEEYMKYKQKTPARVGVFRAGPRYKTNTLLRFRADHAVAMDAVFSNVSNEFLKEMNLFTVETMCSDKDEYLTRPDLGRKLNEDAVKILNEKCKKNPSVQIYVSDGLSSTAIEANVADTLPALIQGLEGYGIGVGTPFFVKYGRVGAMDQIAEVLSAKVTCVLIGERPGLATGESMSCYITYNGHVGISESKRTVVSNIHKNGTSAAEAGAHVAHIIKKILDAKASGIDLKL